MEFITQPERSEPGSVGPEHAQISRWLDYYRATLVHKCSGLTFDQLASRPVPTTNLSLLGLMRHLTDVELGWFVRCIEGEAPGQHYFSPEDPDHDFDRPDDEPLDVVYQRFNESVRRSREILSAHDLDDIAARPNSSGDAIDVRWVCDHMLEEYARHVGHADLLREAIDGAVGD